MRTSAFVVCLICPPPLSCRSGRRPQPGDERQDFSGECGLKRPTKGGITTESFGTEVTTGPEQQEMPIYAHLSPSSCCLIVLLGYKRGAAAIHEHTRTCRSRIARCARSA